MAAPPIQRPDLYLVARLLENLARAGGPVRPTALQLASGINYTQLERYIGFLVARGLVAASEGPEGTRTLTLTPKGHEALGFLARTIRDVLREEFGRADPGARRGS